MLFRSPKSGMRHIAPGGRIDGRHADFGGLGHERTSSRQARSTIQGWTLPVVKRTSIAVAAVVTYLVLDFVLIQAVTERQGEWPSRLGPRRMKCKNERRYPP